MSAREWQTLSESLDELARTDPDVAKAEKRLNDYIDDHLWRARSGVPVSRFTPGCGSKDSE